MQSKWLLSLVAIASTTSIHGFNTITHAPLTFSAHSITTTSSQTRTAFLYMSKDPSTAESDDVSIDNIGITLKQHQTDFNDKIKLAQTVDDAESIRNEYLTKKGPINREMSSMRFLSDEEKPKLGKMVNTIKAEIEATAKDRKIQLGWVEPVEADDENDDKKQKKKSSPPPSTTDTVVDISKIDLRVGVITKAWDHPEGDKLFCEEIDIGEPSGPRQIASGLRAHYDLDDLVGQRVVVMANLKTRKLMGFPSQGMVVCAAQEDEDGGKVEFIEPPLGAKVGERIMVEGFDGEPATENQVLKKKMLNVIFPDLVTDANGVATYKGVALATSAGQCVAQNKLPNAPVG